MTHATRDDASNDMDDIALVLKKAGTLYLNSRRRSGIHEFLRCTYSIYWVLKRRGKLGQQKRLLRKAAGLPASPSRRLSDLILIVAAKDCDRRDRHRWKKFLEAAFQQRIHPRDLIKELHALHGVNNALVKWMPSRTPSKTTNDNSSPSEITLPTSAEK